VCSHSLIQHRLEKGEVKMRKLPWRKAPAVQIESPETEGCLDDNEETTFEREEKERDQYPNRMTAEEIDEIVDRQLKEYEAEWEHIVGFTEISQWRDLSGNLTVASAKVVRRERGQVVEIKLGELFLRVCVHSKQDVELPSLRQIGFKKFEVCVPGIVLGLPPVPTQPHRVDTDPTDICRFLGRTKAQWSDTTMIASVCRDENASCGLYLHIKTFGEIFGCTEIELRAVGGWSEFPTLRTSRGSNSVEVDISRLVLGPSEDG
jgi:hypothetical protein